MTEQADADTTHPADSSEVLTSTSSDLRRLICKQLDSLQRYQQAFLELDNVEAIHKLRVTTRRLQSSLDLLQSKNRKLTVRQIIKSLRKWRRELSRTRNFDIFLQLVNDASSRCKKSHKEQYESLHTELIRLRSKARIKAVSFTRGINVDLIRERLGFPLKTEGSLIANKPASIDTETQAAIQVQLFADDSNVMDRATRRLEERRRSFEALSNHPLTSSDTAAVHQLRIAAKRLRYLIEVLSEIGYGINPAALKWLRTLQDRAGEWHDLDVFEYEIVALVRKRNFMRSSMARSGDLLLAASRIVKKKELFVKTLFPIKAPKSLMRSVNQLIATLMSDAYLDKR